MNKRYYIAIRYKREEKRKGKTYGYREVLIMLSFPIDFYCTYHNEDTTPEWMKGERMSYCDQVDARRESVLSGIREFFSKLF